ncbi:MAG: cytochrome c3 family protein, partial [Desulfobacterales bacterium]
MHISAGMVCADCHYRSDVHGDGRLRQSMRHVKGVRASCEECHVEQERESPEFDPDTESHSVHGDKLACAACHVQNTVSCYNCHFDSFLKTGKKKGNFVPMKDWLLLINHEGQVTSGNVQTLVYQNKKFVAYAPYFTHSIRAEGRLCDDCHQNKAVQRIQNGSKVPVVGFENGELQTWKGVVPVMKGKLE